MEQFEFPFQETTVKHLPQNIQNLIQAAGIAAGKAYAPYFNFKVGAAAEMIDGSIKVGSNHENASYPAGTCAERGLLSNINPTDKTQLIKAIVVTYISETADANPLSPCGICRQTILEQQLAQGESIAVYMCSPDGRVTYVEDASFLLPFYFSRKNLG